MTYLPIAARELSVAARKPGTYRLRALSVLAGLIVLAVVSLGDVPKIEWGHTILFSFGVATLGFCIMAGLLLTAHSIAAEREGGTLGLLFLTDLKGHDIVLGKLAAHSANAFFGLLAGFPVLALPLLMGGVTGLEVARLVLVFCTTLLFSLSLGLAVSSMTGDPKRALGGAMLLMALLAGLLPALWWLNQSVLKVARLDFLLWPSPAFAFSQAFDTRYRARVGAAEYWHSVQTLWLMTALCLAWASYMTPRAWQAQEAKATLRRSPRRKPRGWELVEAQNPFGRVTIRDWAPSSMANLLLAVVAPIFLCFFFAVPWCRPPGAPVPYIVCLFLGLGLHLLVKLMMTLESVSRLHHDRHSGA